MTYTKRFQREYGHVDGGFSDEKKWTDDDMTLISKQAFEAGKAESQSPDPWLPISSAPKDGTEIQGGWPFPFQLYTGTPICWQATEEKEGWFLLSPAGRHVTGRLPDYADQWLDRIDYPSHWKQMPLPPKPKEI